MVRVLSIRACNFVPLPYYFARNLVWKLKISSILSSLHPAPYYCIIEIVGKVRRVRITFNTDKKKKEVGKYSLRDGRLGCNRRTESESELFQYNTNIIAVYAYLRTQTLQKFAQVIVATFQLCPVSREDILCAIQAKTAYL